MVSTALSFGRFHTSYRLASSQVGSIAGCSGVGSCSRTSKADPACARRNEGQRQDVALFPQLV